MLFRNPGIRTRQRFPWIRFWLRGPAVCRCRDQGSRPGPFSLTRSEPRAETPFFLMSRDQNYAAREAIPGTPAFRVSLIPLFFDKMVFFFCSFSFFLNFFRFLRGNVECSEYKSTLRRDHFVSIGGARYIRISFSITVNGDTIFFNESRSKLHGTRSYSRNTHVLGTIDAFLFFLYDSFLRIEGSEHRSKLETRTFRK